MNDNVFQQFQQFQQMNTIAMQHQMMRDGVMYQRHAIEQSEYLRQLKQNQRKGKYR